MTQFSATPFYKAYDLTINSDCNNEQRFIKTNTMPLSEFQREDDRILSKNSFFTYTYNPLHSEINKDESMLSIEPEFSNFKQKKNQVAEITKLIDHPTGL